MGHHRPDEVAQSLKDVIAFPVTPFLDAPDQPVDWASFEAGIEFILAGGITAVVVAAGTGEMFSLTPGEIVEASRRAVQVSRGRATVFAGVGFGPMLAADLAEAVAEDDVDGVVVLPPSYPTPDVAGLSDYYQRIADRVPRLAVVPYSRGAARLTPDVLRRLSHMPNVVAIKDGQADIRLFLRNRSMFGDRFVWVSGAGDDVVGPFVAAGAEGYTSSIACFDPALAKELWRLASSHQFVELNRLSTSRIQPWYELRTRRPGYEVTIMKAAMELRGLRAGSVRPPLARLAAEDLDAVREVARVTSGGAAQ